MSGWSRPSVALAVVLGSLLALLGLERLAAPPQEPTGSVTVDAGQPATSGRSVCAVGDEREATSTSLDVVHPGRAGDAPTRARIDRFVGGDASQVDDVELLPHVVAATSLAQGGAGVAGQVVWSEAPATVARRWRIGDEAEDLPPGTAAGPCPTSTAPTSWTIPGMSTAGGAEAVLRLANPHGTGATVAVRLLTTEGPETPTLLRNVSVGPESVRELSLNEFAPERADLAVDVQVLSGRVAVEGIQLTRAAIGDIDGVSLLTAANAPGETWTVPWVTDTDDRDTWLWVTNPTDRTARLQLTVHTDQGGVPAEGLSEVEVPPTSVRRIDLRGTLPEDVTSAAMTARSDGVPVVVAGAVEVRADDVADTGFVVQTGAVDADPVWAVTGGSTEARSEQLRLVNPTSEPARADVILSDGSTTSAPQELTGLEVPAGALVTVPLADELGDVEAWSAVVRTREGALVVGQVGNGDADGAAHWVAGPGAPSAGWRTIDGPSLRQARGTVQRLGTELGIRPFDPLAPPVQEEDAAEPGDDPIEGPGLGDPTAPPADAPDGGPAPEPGQDGADEDAPDGEAPTVPEIPDDG